jgi:alpha-glucosidase
VKRLLIALLPPLAAVIVVGVAAFVTLRDDGGGDSGPASPAVEDGEDTASSAPRLAPESNVCQGLLHRPEPGSPRTFAAEYTQRREAAGIAIVANADVDARALDKAVATVNHFFGNNELEETLVAEGAYVIVAAGGQGVLDLPEFRCLDNDRNQDYFSHVCGVADLADYPVVTVNERDLLGNRRGPCAGLNILYHELGHLVQGWAMPHADYIDVRQFFQDALADGKYRDDYAATNFREYFAEATQAYFLSSDPSGDRDRDWLREYDPQIFELLDRLYRD